MNPTKTDPISERAKLQAQLRATAEADGREGERLAGLEHARQANERSRAAAFKALHREDEGAEKAVDKAERERDRLALLSDRSQVSLRAAREGRRELEQQLKELLVRELPTFAEEADQATQAALEAFVALAEPYQLALEAWQRAEAAWAPLASAVRGSVVAADEAEGLWRGDERVQRDVALPAFPLPADTHMFALAERGALAPRPAALKPGTPASEPDDD